MRPSFNAVWVDVQTSSGQPDPAQAFPTLLESIDLALEQQHPDSGRPDAAEMDALLRRPATALLNYLKRLSEMDPRPPVLLFDEADSLAGRTMASFLTQLRKGYIARSRRPFPASIALVGQRQVRDYVLEAKERGAVAWLRTASPFNITAEAATLGPFNEGEVAELLAQHTAATGQRFEPAAVQRIYELGQGHPWLTNALADQIVGRDVLDRGIAVSELHVDSAKETIILERRSHIDSLVARLREPRVRRIIEPMLVGDRLPADLLDDDLAYVVGLGLVAVRERFAQIANPIYREVIPRALTYVQQVSIPDEPAWYVRPDGGLDLEKERHAIEVKLRRDTETEAEALDQIARYLEHAGLDEGWLLLFDLRKEVAWSEKLTSRELAHAGKRVRVVGC